jgi:hypothetical protein
MNGNYHQHQFKYDPYQDFQFGNEDENDPSLHAAYPSMKDIIGMNTARHHHQHQVSNFEESKHSQSYDPRSARVSLFPGGSTNS